MHKEQIAELLYQAYETEQGGEKVYETALKCAENEDLREEWEKYLEQTREHIEIVREAMLRSQTMDEWPEPYALYDTSHVDPARNGGRYTVMGAS